MYITLPALFASDGGDGGGGSWSVSTDREIRAGRRCDARNDREIQSGDINAEGERERKRAGGGGEGEEGLCANRAAGFLSLTRPCVCLFPSSFHPIRNFSEYVAARYPRFLTERSETERFNVLTSFFQEQILLQSRGADIRPRMTRVIESAQLSNSPGDS